MEAADIHLFVPHVLSAFAWRSAGNHFDVDGCISKCVEEVSEVATA